MVHATLCFIVRDGAPPHVLLGKKKRGFGMGKLNGIGGKLEPGELPDDGVIREVEEEVGITIHKSGLHPAGRITFRFPFMKTFDHFVHVYCATEWEGEPIETEEMLPSWFSVNEIPFERMWQDDAYWLPIVLGGKHIVAEFTFGEDNETVTDWVIRKGDACRLLDPETRTPRC
ncbi:8-oxo-dGTP diphosphatase [Candidatus Bipolaricaulota bacterium]|nr:8-oxo-dGTP diphosphatase [Candidatus Bipolaricaulota bacterium]